MGNFLNLLLQLPIVPCNYTLSKKKTKMENEHLKFDLGTRRVLLLDKHFKWKAKEESLSTKKRNDRMATLCIM